MQSLARKLAVELLSHVSGSDVAIAKLEAALLRMQHAQREHDAMLADDRLQHWRAVCQRDIDAKCPMDLYNMGCRAEAATILDRIKASPGPEGDP